MVFNYIVKGNCKSPIHAILYVPWPLAFDAHFHELKATIIKKVFCTYIYQVAYVFMSFTTDINEGEFCKIWKRILQLFGPAIFYHQTSFTHGII